MPARSLEASERERERVKVQRSIQWRFYNQTTSVPLHTMQTVNKSSERGPVAKPAKASCSSTFSLIRISASRSQPTVSSRKPPRVFARAVAGSGRAGRRARRQAGRRGEVLEGSIGLRRRVQFRERKSLPPTRSSFLVYIFVQQANKQASRRLRATIV